jgi:hypothetical protein
MRSTPSHDIIPRTNLRFSKLKALRRGLARPRTLRYIFTCQTRLELAGLGRNRGTQVHFIFDIDFQERCHRLHAIVTCSDFIGCKSNTLLSRISRMRSIVRESFTITCLHTLFWKLQSHCCTQRHGGSRKNGNEDFDFMKAIK